MGYPRIEYNDIKVDFNRHFNDYDPERIDSRDENEATSGIIETLHFFGRGLVTAFNERLKAGLIRELREWYRYVRLGNTFKLWWDRGLGMYLSFEGKSLKTNDEVDGVFTRTGVAYYEDDDTGQVEEVAADTPRFPSGKFGRGLLLEGNSENIILRSEEFDNVAWTKTNITVHADTTQTLDPEGGATADRLVTLAAGGNVYQDTATALGTDDGVFSIWIKTMQGIDDLVTLHIEDDTGASKATKTITPTLEWVRYDVEYDSTGADADNWRVKLSVAASTGATTIYVWGAQLEVGASVRYPTSYMPTVAAAVTRNDELLYYDLTNDLNIGYLKGSFSFWFKPNWPEASIGERCFFSVVDSSNNVSMAMWGGGSGAGHGVSFAIYTADGGALSSAGTGGTTNKDEWNHVIGTYDLTISSGIKVYLNGVSLGTNLSDAFLPRIPSKLYIGFHFGAAGTELNSVIDDFEVRKEVYSQADVTAIFGLGKAFGWTRNYWESLLLIEPNFSPILNRGGNTYDFELKAKEEIT